MRQVLFLVLYLLTNQAGYASSFEEELEYIGKPLHWELDTYRTLKKLPELDPKNSDIVSLENLMDTPFNEWEGLYPVHTVDSFNNICMILISLPTKNLFNLENHFFTQHYLAANEETRKKFDSLFKMLGIPKEDSIFGYYFFKKDHDSQQIRLDLPCISRVSKKETKHNEVARCLRTSAMYNLPK
jgi:hypothetical protein